VRGSCSRGAGVATSRGHVGSIDGPSSQGPAAVVALEAGWITTEVGRQPWIVYNVMRTRDAVSTASGLRYGYFLLIVVYASLTAAAAFVLRRMSPTDQGSES
jgi:cytochrome bd-type quinol oxidase subunit 1